eukprot:s2207_g1.t3
MSVQQLSLRLNPNLACHQTLEEHFSKRLQTSSAWKCQQNHYQIDGGILVDMRVLFARPLRHVVYLMAKSGQCLRHQQTVDAVDTMLTPVQLQQFEGSLKLFQVMHMSVERASRQFLEKNKRHVYITPTSYLELLSSFISVLAMKRKQVRRCIRYAICVREEL